ncbi:nucleotidyltransferase domain-containing protein [Streptoalloteichus tenebrarius]|nr:nucleotidyltransferase domain-containing protein [Streptoalloteichus tenebrarius]
MRRFQHVPGYLEDAAQVLGTDEAEAEAVLTRFSEAGYLEVAPLQPGVPSWITTVRGNALANATFARPITRATAQRHLDGFLARVRTYNADRRKPYTVARVVVFGSYLDQSQDRLSDLDLAIQVVRRGGTDEFRARCHAVVADSGRQFSSSHDRLFWPLRELVLYLRDRKAAISLTDEDITTVTDRWACVYDVRGDEDAEQPPAEAVQPPAEAMQPSAEAMVTHQA